MSERLNIKNMLVEPEKPTSPTIESVTNSLRPFLLETFKDRWGYKAELIAQVENNIDSTQQPLKAIDYVAKKADVNPARMGEYTLNPDTATIDWESINPSSFTILELADMRNKPLDEVAKYIVDTYGQTHYIPGLEYWQYILEHPDKMPDEMKNDTPKDQNGKTYFMFGSLVRYQSGHWNVVYAQWRDNHWSQDTFKLDDGWYLHCRVVLIEKHHISQNTFQPDQNPPLPNQRNF